jgi:hypothetical protein
MRDRISNREATVEQIQVRRIHTSAHFNDTKINQAQPPKSTAEPG